MKKLTIIVIMICSIVLCSCSIVESNLTSQFHKASNSLIEENDTSQDNNNYETDRNLTDIDFHKQKSTFKSYFIHDNYHIGVVQDDLQSIKLEDGTIFSWKINAMKEDLFEFSYKYFINGAVDFDSAYTIGDSLIIYYEKGTDGENYLKSRRTVQSADKFINESSQKFFKGFSSAAECYDEIISSIDLFVNNLPENEKLVLTLEDATRNVLELLNIDISKLSKEYDNVGDIYYVSDDLLVQPGIRVISVEQKDLSSMENYQFIILISDFSDINNVQRNIFSVSLDGTIIEIR